MDALTRPMKALIVDDDPVNRKLLRAILNKEGYEPFVAENGQQAIDVYNAERPDIILMDIMMPVMNGYDAARRIKALSVERFVPIIFLTAVTDEEALSRCVESGGDDFLTKPYNRVILKAKINAMERIRGLYTTLNLQKQELERYRSSIQHELEFAEHIFQNITTKGSVDLPYLKFWTSTLSMSMFNGDLFLASRKPSGGIHLLMCDFTGHGLPAAVGALPVSEVFVAMTDRGFSMADILTEMNRKLRRELPTGFFCAAGFADIDVTQGTLSVWNGGLPELVAVDKTQNILRRFSSSHLPLGIRETVFRPADIEVMEITEGLHLLMYTDGLVETVNEEGEMFGMDRLNTCFDHVESGDSTLNYIQESVIAFRGEALQHDDISMLQLDCFQARYDIPQEVLPTGPQGVLDAEWRMEFDLSARILRDINPVPMVLNMLTHIRVPDEHRKRIFTILMELYTNAMDHGLLQLHSSLKSTPEGFAKYYLERDERLNQLNAGKAKIVIEQRPVEDGYVLRICLEDTGAGFDLKLPSAVAPTEQRNMPSGRGINLVRSLCRQLEYTDGGSTATATYYLGKKNSPTK